MRSALVVAGWFVALVVVTAAERAHACGTWSLEDRELGRKVTFHASTVSVSAKKSAGGYEHILRIDDDGTGESVRSVSYGWKKRTPPPPEHTFAKNVLLHRGKPIGDLREGAFTIHGRDYVVTTSEVAAGVAPNDGPFDDVAWIVDVTHDGAPILHGLGRTICADYDPSVDLDVGAGNDEAGEWRGKAKVKLTDALKREIMLRRIAIYLAATRVARR